MTRQSRNSLTPVVQPEKRKRRLKSERGLPADSTLREMAITYISVQFKLWPNLIKKGKLPADQIDEMVRQFKDAFLVDSAIDLSSLSILGVPLASSYSRYSDTNSNPRSLPQQLRLELEKARALGHFIPWQLVFADAAVTATTANRRGYQLAKRAISDPKVQCLYIDEIGRASREGIESLELGRYIEDLDKRIVGASDGFDSDLPMSKMMLAVYAMLNEWFVDQLRSKVNRGMDDAFRRGSNTGLPAPGYKLETMHDVSGSPIHGADGDEARCLAIDTAEAKVILHVFRLYAERHWSPERIAKFLNRITFHGTKLWDGSRVRKLLRRHTYIGIKTYRMTRPVRDRKTNKVKVVKRPRSEWNVQRARHLQIIPFKLWKAAKRRLRIAAAKWSNNGNVSATRAHFYPATLFRPICGDCGRPLILGRSGKYAAFKCGNGSLGKAGCAFKGYKAVNIVEKCLLAAVRDRCVQPELVDQITDHANAFLSQLAKVPKADTTLLKKHLKKLTTGLDNLYKLAQAGRRLEQLSARIEVLETRRAKVQKKLRSAERQNEAPPAPLTKEAVLKALGSLHELMKQDIASAAPVLAELTGPIKVHQVREKGKKRPTWTATFDLNLTPVLVKLAREHNCPSKDTWEFLNTRSWTTPCSLEVELESVPPYQQLSAAISDLASKGVAQTTIAAEFGVTVILVRSALHYARTGKKPIRPAIRTAKDRTVTRGTRTMVYKHIAAEVARRRDQDFQSFVQISRELQVGEATARRAYDHAHPEKVAEAVKNCTLPERGRYQNLGATGDLPQDVSTQ